LIPSSTFGNRPIAVKVGLGFTWAEPVVMRTAGIGATLSPDGGAAIDYSPLELTFGLA
jgi:hypothetical protein